MYEVINTDTRSETMGPATWEEDLVGQRVCTVPHVTNDANSPFSNIGSHVNCLVGDTPDIEQRNPQPASFNGRDAGLLVAFDLGAFVASIGLQPTRRHQQSRQEEFPHSSPLSKSSGDNPSHTRQRVVLGIRNQSFGLSDGSAISRMAESVRTTRASILFSS
jgi:hypothetical protein